MKKKMNSRYFKYALIVIILAGIFSAGLYFIRKGNHLLKEDAGNSEVVNIGNSDESGNASMSKESDVMPVYGHWRNFTTKDGLPSDHAYTVRIDGDRVLVGTHEGLSEYKDGKWKTYTTKDGLAHNGVVSIDVSKQTGDVWIGTLGGLTRWSAGKFETFTQFNSGLPNDLV
jgi:ligand-binding sensor domain-containing protein